MSNAAVWESVLSAVEKRINHESFTTWFRPITFMNSDPSAIYLKVPDRVFEDWILNNYRTVLEESLQEADLAGHEIRFEVDSRPAAEQEPGDHISPRQESEYVNPYPSPPDEAAYHGLA